jgi:transcriptional regulator with XRE-family HTH domain
MKTIRIIRNRKGLTLEEVAAESGIHISSLIRIETGHGNPTVHTLAQIAQALDVPIRAFFMDVGVGSETGAGSDRGTVGTGTRAARQVESPVRRRRGAKATVEQLLRDGFFRVGATVKPLAQYPKDRIAVRECTCDPKRLKKVPA